MTTLLNKNKTETKSIETATTMHMHRQGHTERQRQRPDEHFNELTGRKHTVLGSDASLTFRQMIWRALPSTELQMLQTKLIYPKSILKQTEILRMNGNHAKLQHPLREEEACKHKHLKLLGWSDHEFPGCKGIV